MKKLNGFLLSSMVALALAGCNNQKKSGAEEAGATGAASDSVATTAADTLKLPEPFATPATAKLSNIIGWPAGETPVAPAGFTVTKFADGLDSPRWIYVAPNGDLFIAESNKNPRQPGNPKEKGNAKGFSADRITLLRDADKDGKPELRQVYLQDLNQPFGMLVLNDYFYVANTDALYRFPYKAGQTKITGKGEKIMDLPAGGYNNHWTRNIIANADGSKIYISVGSSSNVGENGMEHEVRRANILEINPDGSGERVFASGLRNPSGLDWAPGSNMLWTAVNERDNLGDDLVPDYITSVKEGAFYGWPYSYFGQHEDPRLKGQRPDLVKKAIAPDVPVGAHTGTLGLAFYDQKTFPQKYHNGAFVGQHGSWNRSKFAGYRVAFVPFANGKPSGPPEDFLTGFIADPQKGDVYGRPIGVAVLPDGSLLVADDSSNILWRVTAQK
ncbi:PQQ-dependent sugar dehydrogenase [Adhaeribacter aquaticus]|uniref:PQQ-dependent sugar dehydrogenase n=1 Tax=Adhaeribacter aquaticus TaxID=299567 RepID=UPI0003FE25B5|nr:sorbosone dehydrogenase family protein [Adhaeribacter aquaticus]